MLIRGGDPENMQFGDTLNADKFKGYTFDYIISNPPFGIDWKREAADVEKEHKLGDAGRFGVGLPQKIRWTDAVLTEWHCKIEGHRQNGYYPKRFLSLHRRCRKWPQ